MKTRMVKRGGTKRKIPMVKIGKKESLATAFTKRSYGLHSKASQLCLLSGAQIAVSFGHSSVTPSSPLFSREIVLLPLVKRRVRRTLGYAWPAKIWPDALARSENPQELTEAINSMSSLLAKFKELRKGESFCKRNDKERSEPDQTLIPQSDSAITDEIVAFSPSEQSQILAIRDNKDVALDQEMDVDQLIDFEAFDTEELDAWLLESGQMVPGDFLTNPYLIPDMAPQNRDLDQDNRRFSDLFNTIAAL